MTTFPLTPGTGAVQCAALADSGGAIHQQAVLEFVDGSGFPTAPSKTNPFPVASRNHSTPVNIDTANNTAVTIANAAAVLTGLYYYNDSPTETVFVKLYNVAAPTSASTPVATFKVSPYDTLDKQFTEPLAFATAIGVRITTGAATGNTTSPTGANVGTAFYRLI